MDYLLIYIIIHIIFSMLCFYKFDDVEKHVYDEFPYVMGIIFTPYLSFAYSLQFYSFPKLFKTVIVTKINSEELEIPELGSKIYIVGSNGIHDLIVNNIEIYRLEKKVYMRFNNINIHDKTWFRTKEAAKLELAEHYYKKIDEL